MASTIRQLRTKQGLSQQALADKAGVSEGAIRAWESGARGLLLRSARKVAAALGVSTDDIEE
jgi:transcriptional regulator with XRE-family HTH domain